MGFDRSKFLEQFKQETREHIRQINNGLIKLEKDPRNKEFLEMVMRQAHTIKGSSIMMGYKRIADIAHSMESGLEKAIKEEIALTKANFDILFKCIDTIEPLLEDKVVWEDKGVAYPFVEELCKEVDDSFQSKPPEKKRHLAPGKKQKPPLVDSHLEKPKISFVPPVQETSIRVDIQKMDKLMNHSGELVISRIRLGELTKEFSRKIESDPELTKTLSSLSVEFSAVDQSLQRLTDGIEDEVMKLRMVPVAYLFNTFPRAMRDLAQERSKEIEFQIKGEDVRLDKSIIDEMKEPIMHLLRNAVDHGIEPVQERLAKNKAASGNINLSAYQQGSQVIIEVSDDGRGIDVQRVKEEIINRGLVTGDKIDSLSVEQIYEFLFVPGFTTSSQVTEISGRGVGLDIVRDSLSKMKGLIEVFSEKDKGARFILKLPLTLAITESLLVVSGKDTFAIPIDSVVETLRINLDQIKTVEGKEVISARGNVIPILRLCDIFGLPQRGIIEKKFFPVIIVQSAERKIGILVDKLAGRQEIIRKSLGELLNNVPGVSGAAILGNGSVILIIDIRKIIDSSDGFVVKRPKTENMPLREKRKKTILLAEDALSTAMLEKNILESAGFSVVIARDGQEAMEKLNQEKFDLIITDILMPRMDGFELTRNTKRDKLFKDIPVIIVTTRESDADRRHGLEAGADAYILKSEFTSEGLLETIERLIG